MPVEITPEIRQQVLDQICAERGHQINAWDAFAPAQGAEATGAPGSTDDTKLPHMTCANCGRVWIIVPNSGKDYADAERVFYRYLRAESKPARDLLRNQARREQRDRPPKPPKGGKDGSEK